MLFEFLWNCVFSAKQHLLSSMNSDVCGVHQKQHMVLQIFFLVSSKKYVKKSFAVGL